MIKQRFNERTELGKELALYNFLGGIYITSKIKYIEGV